MGNDVAATCPWHPEDGDQLSTRPSIFSGI